MMENLEKREGLGMNRFGRKENRRIFSMKSRFFLFLIIGEF